MGNFEHMMKMWENVTFVALNKQYKIDFHVCLDSNEMFWNHSFQIFNNAFVSNNVFVWQIILLINEIDLSAMF